jgi:hypothetical protein
MAAALHLPPRKEVRAMAEVLMRFDTPLLMSEDRTYLPRACGREMEGGLWEGWIEFLPDDGSPVVRSRRETVQPNREAAAYWAAGLTPVYLEGALDRATEPPRPVATPSLGEPAFLEPAPEPWHEPRPVAVLDPFSVYQKGEDLLRQQLSALSRWHLRNIGSAYGLLSAEELEARALSRADLAERILLGVKSRLPEPAKS